MRGGARRPHARRTPCTLSVRPRAPTKQMGPYRRSREAATGAPYRLERAAWRRGLVRVAGIDEAGRGPLAGPVVAAAVVLRPDRVIDGVDDSKRLTREERSRLLVDIRRHAMAVAVGIIDAATIDRINILEATRMAMGQAVKALTVHPELVLTDWVSLSGLSCPQRNLVRGDQRSASVAAASIVAKVTRDRLMAQA